MFSLDTRPFSNLDELEKCCRKSLRFANRMETMVSSISDGMYISVRGINAVGKVLGVDGFITNELTHLRHPRAILKDRIEELDDMYFDALWNDAYPLSELLGSHPQQSNDKTEE